MCLDWDWVITIGFACLIVGGSAGFVLFGLMAISKTAGGWEP